MTTEIKITQKLYNEIFEDLQRPHEFAGERIGFISAKVGDTTSDHKIIILYKYFPVEDGDYIDDPMVGAKIGSTAIRKAMQRILDTGESLFHVHLHYFSGKPRLSSVDRNDIPPVIKSFQAVKPNAPHGIFLLGKDACTSVVLLPNSAEFVKPEKISIIGFPLRIYKKLQI